MTFITQDVLGILLQIVLRSYGSCIVFQAGDRINAAQIQLVEHCIIDIPATANNHTVTRQVRILCAGDLMNNTVREIQENRELTIMIQLHAELDGPFGLATGRPRKCPDTKFD